MAAIKWLDQLVLAINQKVERWINKSLEQLKESIIEKTPEDTWELIGNNKIEKAHMEGLGIVWSISNKTPYAWDVETWFDNSVTFNYHRRNWNGRVAYYRWWQNTPGQLWARMYTRAFDELEQTIITNIKNA